VHRLAERVSQYARNHDLLRAGDRVGVAVSGGADSVGLLRILLELRQHLGIVLSVIHLNHQLRGRESDADEQFVRELAARYDLEFLSESWDVNRHAAEKKLSLETAAREIRYEFFANFLRLRNLDKVATAHTLDDQAETVLMRLLRGTGLRGVGSIRPRLFVRDEAAEICGEIVRPLLAERRTALKDYISDVSQDWREDATNRDMKHTRNRIRLSLLPFLEKEFNPSVAQKLAELADIAQSEEAFWNQQCHALFQRIAKPIRASWANATFYPPLEREADLVQHLNARHGPAGIQKTESGNFSTNFGLDLELFTGLSLAVQRRLLQSLESYRITMEFSHIEDVIALTRPEEVDGQIDLPNGWRAVRTENELQFLWLEDGSADKEPRESYEYEMSVPGSVIVPEAGVIVQAQLTQANGGGGDCETLLAPEYASRGLTVRNWRSGDRFWPAHTKAPKKIKELLQDRHITGNQKRRWPVLVCGDEVVWMRGFGVRHDLQPKNGPGVLIRDLPLGEGRSK
jgi:tRNA(Ile)-lysidine synthase